MSGIRVIMDLLLDDEINFVVHFIGISAEKLLVEILSIIEKSGSYEFKYIKDNLLQWLYEEESKLLS